MPVKYLVDASVVIAACDGYYHPKRIPQFCPWLVEQGRSGTIKIPPAIFGEIQPRDNEFESWIQDEEVRGSLILREKLRGISNLVLKAGYQVKVRDDDDLGDIGKDHILIAHALVDQKNRVVVTNEVSQPSRQGRNRKIPDVCKDLDVKCIDDLELYRRLDFNTKPE